MKQNLERRIPSIREIARNEIMLSGLTPMDLILARQQSEKRQETEGYVYFVRCGEYVKIGYTSDPRTRMSKFKTNNPYECTLLAAIDGGRLREAEIQERFSVHLHRGEWYRAEGSLLDFIASLNEPPTSSV